jgi:membrane-bound lytic murein transglycosylase B
MVQIRRISVLCALLGFALAPVMALAQDGSSKAPKITPAVKAGFQNWLVDVRAEALDKGISERVISSALSNLEPVARILERDRKQSEYTITLSKYRKRVITPHNIRVGLAKQNRYSNTLNRVAKRYGVQPRFILAIWGIETRFGAVTGTMPVIPAVATLAFDRRRSKYFRQQLFASLKMLHRGYTSLPEMKGSWAGAMGQPQFMPSSYIAYAQDFDGDGRRDIWSNEGDVFASIANYLAEHGWNDDLTWGRKVIAPANVRRAAVKSFNRKERGCRAMKKMSRNKNLSEWARQGITKADGSPLPNRNLPAAMVLPDGEKGSAYLVYKNYRSILRYNCAHLYAVTTGELADALWVR